MSKRVKAIKLADKSEFGRATVNEYLSDELASDSDDEKRIYQAERRAERKVTKEKRRRARSGDKGSGSASTSRATSSRYASSDLVSRPEASTQHFFALLSLFLSSSIMALSHRP